MGVMLMRVDPQEAGVEVLEAGGSSVAEDLRAEAGMSSTEAGVMATEVGVILVVAVAMSMAEVQGAVFSMVRMKAHLSLATDQQQPVLHLNCCSFQVKRRCLPSHGPAWYVHWH